MKVAKERVASTLRATHNNGWLSAYANYLTQDLITYLITNASTSLYHGSKKVMQRGNTNV